MKFLFRVAKLRNFMRNVAFYANKYRSQGINCKLKASPPNPLPDQGEG